MTLLAVSNASAARLCNYVFWIHEIEIQACGKSSKTVTEQFLSYVAMAMSLLLWK